MGAEVVWVRLYTPSLSTVVYAFAIILGLYLIATDLGSIVLPAIEAFRGNP